MTRAAYACSRCAQPVDERRPHVKTVRQTERRRWLGVVVTGSAVLSATHQDCTDSMVPAGT